MVRKESLKPISNSSDYQGCRCGDLQLQLKPALNLETEDKSGLPQKDTDAQGLYTMAPGSHIKCCTDSVLHQLPPRVSAAQHTSTLLCKKETQ